MADDSWNPSLQSMQIQIIKLLKTYWMNREFYFIENDKEPVFYKNQLVMLHNVNVHSTASGSKIIFHGSYLTQNFLWSDIYHSGQ